MEIRRSEILLHLEVWRDGELTAEWEPEDGPVYTILNPVERDDRALYREPKTGTPDAPPLVLADSCATLL